MMRTDPAAFWNPHSLRNKVGRLLWGLVWRCLFRPTPARFLIAYRNGLLRLFGARIGRAWIHPSVRIWAPWRLSVGDDVFVDEGVYLYNAYGITIGDRVIVSFGACLCSASHDYTAPDYPLIGGPVSVGDDTWIAAQAFICPGVRIGDGAVVGARSVVVKDALPWTVVGGNPARFLKARSAGEK